MASRTSWTLPQSAALPVGRRTTLVTRESTAALRSESTTDADRRRRFEQLLEHAGGLVLEQVAVDLEHQRRIRRDLRSPPHRQADEDEAEDGHGDRHENEHEHNDHTASYSHIGLLEDEYSWEVGRAG